MLNNVWVHFPLPMETNLYRPPLLGGAAVFDNSAPPLSQIQGPLRTEFLYSALNCQKLQYPPSTGGVHE